MKKFSFLSCAIALIGFCACLSCGYLISSAIVASGLISSATSISSESQGVYAISMCWDEDETALGEPKANLQAQNGAGYIYEKDGKFHLLASVYSNKADAELVKNNLSSQGISCEIMTIVIPSKTYEGNFSADEKNVLTECLKSRREMYEKLYDVAISLDTGLLDETKAKLECNNIYSSLITTKANFETMFKNGNLQEISEELKTIESNLSNLISENFECKTQTYSSLVKLTYCKILLG